MSKEPAQQVNSKPRATMAQIVARYVDALNADTARPIKDFLSEFPYLSAGERAQAERSLYFLFASDAIFAGLRLKRLGGEPVVLGDVAAAVVPVNDDMVQDWQAWLDNRSDGAAAALNSGEFAIPAVDSAGGPLRALDVDGAALARQADWQLNYAHWLILDGHIAEGREFLAEVAADQRRYDPLDRSRCGQRISYLYARACLANNEPQDAQAHLHAALNGAAGRAEH